MSRLSQRARVLWVIALAVLPLLAFAGARIWQQYRDDKAAVLEERLARAHTMAFAVQLFIDSQLSTVRALASHPDLASGRAGTQLQAFLRGVMRQNSDWAGIGIALADGYTIFGTRESSRIFLGDRPYFREALATGEPVVSSAIMGRRTGKPTIVIAAPFPLAAGGSGVVLAPLPTERFAAELLAKVGLPSAEVAVIDGDGQTFIHSDPTRVARLESLRGDAAAQAALRGASGSLTRRGPDGERLVAYVPVPGRRWAVLIAEPSTSAFAGARRNAAEHLALLAAALLLVTAIGWVLGGRLSALYQRAEAARVQADAARAQAEALAAVAAAVTGTLELPRVLQTVAEAACRMTASDLARIALPAETPGEFAYRYLVGTREKGYESMRMREGIGFVGEVIRQRRPYRTADARHDPLADPVVGRPLILAEGTRAALIVPILEQERVRGIIYVARRRPAPYTDAEERVCEQLAAHAAIALSNAQLFEAEQVARAQAQAANRAKDEFLAMLGHELRNPLAAVSSAAYVLSGVSLPEPAKAAQEIIARQVAQLSKLLDDLLDVGRVVSGKVSLQRSRVDLAGMARAALGTLEAGGYLSRHRLVVQADTAWVDADPARLEQVAVNLVGNALKFTPAGGEVRVRVLAQGDSAILEVSDTGIGIPRDMLPCIFELFVQAHTEPARGRGGLGIGLTLTRRLVELHGGSIEAESEGSGRGARFVVRLPLAQAPAAAAATGSPEASAGRALDIMLVEDNADARAMLSEALRAHGHSVRVCGTGSEALQQAAARVPDVAILDIGLPGMDGYALACELRARFGPSILLLAVTGYGQDADRRRADEAGFDGHFTKPAAPEALLGELQARFRARGKFPRPALVFSSPRQADRAAG